MVLVMDHKTRPTGERLSPGLMKEGPHAMSHVKFKDREVGT